MPRRRVGVARIVSWSSSGGVPVPAPMGDDQSRGVQTRMGLNLLGCCGPWWLTGLVNDGATVAPPEAMSFDKTSSACGEFLC
jgi:hypothetical protein